MTKILLVEDDRSIITNLTDFLRGEGFAVEAVTGQAGALERLPGEFDLVLLDVSLSDGNGFAVCSAIKREYDLPVIFLTASGDEFSVVTGLDLGADDYVAKPFHPQELIARVKSQLRRYTRLGDVNAAQTSGYLLHYASANVIYGHHKVKGVCYGDLGRHEADKVLEGVFGPLKVTEGGRRFENRHSKKEDEQAVTYGLKSSADTLNDVSYRPALEALGRGGD